MEWICALGMRAVQHSVNFDILKAERRRGGPEELPVGIRTWGGSGEVRA